VAEDRVIAILGGTGPQGLGLALRFCQAGRSVRVGSRERGRAERVCEQIAERLPGAQAAACENRDAAAGASVVVLAVPFESSVATLTPLRDRWAAGQLVVSMGVPLASAVGDGASRTLGVWQGSCAELVASLLPGGVEVASAFQNVSAHRLQQLDQPVDCDVVVSGAAAARRRCMALCALLPGVRAIDGGGLANARIVESLTALLIGMNRRYQVPEGIGVRFTGVPPRPPPAATRR
jgi:8-hydroxy-5-deazaflavin:NADPH oxidoreductase